METEKKIYRLSDLLTKKVRSTNSDKPLNKLKGMEEVGFTGIYKIPESEKPFSIFFVDPLPPLKVNLTPKTYKENLFWLSALLSKCPHYKYIQSSKMQGKDKQYWFKDTSRNITVILTDVEVENKIKYT